MSFFSTSSDNSGFALLSKFASLSLLLDLDFISGNKESSILLPLFRSISPLHGPEEFSNSGGKRGSVLLSELAPLSLLLDIDDDVSFFSTSRDKGASIFLPLFPPISPFHGADEFSTSGGKRGSISLSLK
ncbi:hypothetical protein ACJW30_11G013400 [Castanea mollissima]